MKRNVNTLAALVFTCWISGPAMARGRSAISPQAAKAIAKEAYIYGFPMVMGYKTIYNYAVDKENLEYKGPFNKLSCEARLFTPEDKGIVTPNADTPYCMFWMDGRAEPMVLTVPEMEPHRYYSFQFIGLYTHNFPYVGILKTGDGAGKFLKAGPHWNGKKPAGITDVLRSETGFVLNIIRMVPSPSTSAATARAGISCRSWRVGTIPCAYIGPTRNCSMGVGPFRV